MDQVAMDQLKEAGEDDMPLENVIVKEDALNAVEITTLDVEKAKLAEDFLQERMRDMNPVAKYRRKYIECNDEPSKKEQLRKDQASGPAWWLKLKKIMPVLSWMPQHTRKTILADITAGITVGIMEVPQSMSYANIAGLQYIYGMYAACIPTFVYGCFGDSRQLAVGPVAMLSLLVEAGLRGTLKDCETTGDEQQYEACPEAYAKQAMLTALVVGVMQIVGSMLRLGFLVSFLGHPVISGFTSGAAIIIGLSQLKYIVGFNIEKSQYVYVTLGQLIENIGDTKPMPLILGCIWLAMLIGVKTLSKKYTRCAILGPVGPLVICFLGMGLLAAFPVLYEEYYVKYVGSIPSGLMPFSLFDLDYSAIPDVIPTALSACLIGYMESVAIGKNLASKHGVELDAGQELFAIGVANVAAAAFSGYPVTGSFSRSAVNNQTGAQTQLSGMMTAFIMFCTLVFLTPAFYHLPQFALSAIVMSSVYNLVAYNDAIHLWKVKKNDFVCWVVAFLGTLLLGVLMGILVAMGLSLAIVISESVRPQLAILWRIPGTTIYRSMKQESRGVFVPNVLIVRLGASLYFANAGYVKDSILDFISDLADVDPTKYLILEMTAVTTIDSSAVHALHDIAKDLRHRRIQVAFAMVGNRVEKTLNKAHLPEFIGEQWFFPTVNHAVLYCLCHQQTKETSAPHLAIQGEPGPLNMPNEVGFSNELHHAWTVVFITLSEGVTLLNAQTEFASAFRKHKILVQKAQADPGENGGTKHTYYVRAEASPEKLQDWQIKLLRDDLLDSIESLQTGQQFDRQVTPRTHASAMSEKRVKALEESIAAQSAKLDEVLAKQAKVLSVHDEVCGV